MKFAILDGYYNTPLTLTKFLENDRKYVFSDTDSDLNVDYYSYDSDPRVSVGFDNNGNVAAVRVAVSYSNYLPTKQRYNNGPTII